MHSSLLTFNTAKSLDHEMTSRSPAESECYESERDHPSTVHQPNPNLPLLFSNRLPSVHQPSLDPRLISPLLLGNPRNLTNLISQDISVFVQSAQSVQSAEAFGRLTD